MNPQPPLNISMLPALSQDRRGGQRVPPVLHCIEVSQ